MRIQFTDRKFRLTAMSLAVAAAASIGMPAVAQQGQQAEGLEEVIVTAERREASLQDTPIAITAFTADALTNLGVFDVSQIGDYAPNVQIQKQPSSNSNMGVFIRGVGAGETSLLVDPKIGFYIDGVFMSKTVGGVFDIVDLESIEVLRGPQGTLFGRNTTGGALNVTTQKPTGEWGVKATASAGRFDYERYGASINLPAFANLASKVSFNRMKTDGWATNHYVGAPTVPQVAPVEQNLASEDNKSYRVALRWTPTETMTFDYAWDKTDNSGVPAPFQIVKVKDSLYNGLTTTPFPFQFLGGSLYQQMAATVGDPNERREDYNLDGVSPEWLNVEGHSLTAAWDVAENVTLKYIFGKRSTDSGYDSTDLDGGAYTARDLFYGSFAGNNAPIATPGFHAAVDKGKIDMESHELQIIGSFMDDRLQYTGGLYQYKESVIQDNPQAFALPIAFILANPTAAAALGPLYAAFGYCTGPGGLCLGTQRLPIPGALDFGANPGQTDFIYGQDSDSWAAYGQATFAITEQFKLTAGARYTEDEKDAFLFNQNIGPNNLNADDTWDNISYVVTGAYQITDDMNVYLKYTTGYNGGGFSARATTVAGFTTPFDEEEVETWELGMKSEWFNNRLRFNAAIFTNDYTDIQIAQFEAGSGGASSKIVNAGAGTYEGFELEIQAVPVDGLTVVASYGYVDAQFDEYLVRDPATNLFVDISDATTVGQTPENTASLGVQYDFTPFSFGALSMRMDASYKDETVFHPFNNQFDSADDRTLLNARISLAEMCLHSQGRGKLRVDVWGKNLTDEEYRNWGIDFGALGFAGDVFGEPRTYGIDFTYNYN